MKFLTSRQLRIEPGERKGLIAFLNDKLEPVREVQSLWPFQTVPVNKPTGFNMDYPLSTAERHCDSVCCIGGYVAYHGLNHRKRLKVSDYVNRNRSPVLYKLYFPYSYGEDWTTINPAMAKKVIRRFLRTGKVVWPKRKAVPV